MCTWHWNCYNHFPTIGEASLSKQNKTKTNKPTNENPKPNKSTTEGIAERIIERWSENIDLTTPNMFPSSKSWKYISNKSFLFLSQFWLLFLLFEIKTILTGTNMLWSIAWWQAWQRQDLLDVTINLHDGNESAINDDYASKIVCLND